MQCSYNLGRQCVNQATVTLTIIGLDFHSCNQHRRATERMINEQIGPVTAIQELKR